MDKVIYTGMSGAQHALNAQKIHANNLANIKTEGFRKDYSHAVANVLPGAGHPSRIMVETQGGGSSLAVGTLSRTGRDLDLALPGPGWFVLMDEEGNEAYTRAGHFVTDLDGRLVSENGMAVSAVGGGEIILPPYRDVEIGAEGGISIIPVEGGEPVEVGTLKLVNPTPMGIYKHEDGMFRSLNGLPAAHEDRIRLKSGYLEDSNVSAVEEMIKIMDLSRQFEFQLKIMKTASELAAAGDKLIRES
ncbi:flagellar basal body rod protein FlgF [Endozoicomonas sp. Mp262]|uniref:flagellar basal body rod protein FlgF n=1 Tax=Endozoicomonas sp. Mp262 TaxID=2919499 RepID=UPI0021D99579